MLKPRYIKKIGAELEGAFAPEIDFPYIKVDSSVSVLGPCGGIVRHPKTRKRVSAEDGEINSPAFSDHNKLKSWVNKYFPLAANNTCGYHIHVSFKKVEYRDMLLANREFHDTFLEDLTKWLKPRRITKPFKVRLAGRHGYCQTNNFEPSWGSSAIRLNTGYGTIEFRIFSMVITPSLAQEIIDWTHNYVEYWLCLKIKT